MDTCPQLFRCHPNLDDEVNRNIVASEIEGGAFLDDLPARTTLHIQTQHRRYTVVHCGQGEAWIWGHPTFCPEPLLVRRRSGSATTAAFPKERQLKSKAARQIEGSENPSPSTPQ